MTEQEKTIAMIFDKSVEALGIMTKSLCDAIKSTKTDLQTDRLYTADDMEAFAEFVGKFSTRKRTITYDTVSNKWFIKELKEGTLNTTFYTTAQLHELWEKERKEATEL